LSNRIYPATKKLFLDADLDLSVDTIKVALIDLADYTYNSAHDFFNDVPGAAVVGTPQALASKTTTGGVFDAADVTFTAVSGDPCEALIIYKDTGNAATSPLIAFIDTGVTGLPVTPSGGDIQVQWNASGIFALTDV
jgi:hypothetical protein